jgi:hypothetical protein
VEYSRVPVAFQSKAAAADASSVSVVPGSIELNNRVEIDWFLL